jgi:hypothetical protein
MNAYATVAQIQSIADGGRRCWAGRCGGNARICVCRLTTDMRTPQGQAAFGHNVQTIITCSYMDKPFSNRYFWTCLLMRVKCIYSGAQTRTKEFYMNYLYLRIIPAQLSRSAKQHPSNSAHLMRRFVRVCPYLLANFSFLVTSEPNSRRVPRVGRVWLAPAHTQAFQTPPST